MKRDNLRKRVFESAWQIVETEGVDNLNVRKLAQMSSCSLGSIYNAFGSFQDLLLHINATVLTRLYGLLQETAERGIEEKKTLRSLFRELGFAYIEFGQKNRLLWKALFEHSIYGPIPEWYAKHAKEGIYRICKKISDAFSLPEDDANRLFGFFWAAIHGVSSILLNRKMEMVADLFHPDSLEPYVEYCLDGLCKEGKGCL